MKGRNLCKMWGGGGGRGGRGKGWRDRVAPDDIRETRSRS